MKYIQKRSEPAEFIAWKTTKRPQNRDWETLNFDKNLSISSDLKNALIDEQGFICCYCCCAVDSNSSHIEHLKPKSRFPQNELDYDNLLISCQGETKNENKRKSDIHCGHKKGNWYDPKLMVSPLSIGCEAKFNFDTEGSISGNTIGATKTIEKLNLDALILRKKRRSAIKPYVDALAKAQREDIEYVYELLISTLRERHNGKHIPFCPAITSVLSSLSQ